MKEGEPNKEYIKRGELYFLWHPETENVFSGYGLTMKARSKEHLIGLLMVDRPSQGVTEWLNRVEEACGGYELVVMTASGERGLLCQMQVEPDSQPLLKRFPSSKAADIEMSLKPLLVNRPIPSFIIGWDGQRNVWRSQQATLNELSPSLRELFERIGYGCLAVEANIGIVHVCHAADDDIAVFADKPVMYRWQLIRMPDAPLIRLECVILDNPINPFRFESFLNVAAEDQADVLAQLANQEELYFTFYGDDLGFRFSKVVPHDEQQWQLLDEIVAEATDYWNELQQDKRDFDKAKVEFMKRFI